MTDTNGGVWTVSNLTERVGSRIATADDNNLYRLNIRDINDMGDDEVELIFSYVANWKNG